MPAYYPRTGPRELSLTPPEYAQNYSASGCGSQYQPRAWHEQPGMCAPDHSRYAPQSGMAASSTVMYQLPGYALSNPGVAPAIGYYEHPMRASTLAPMHRPNQHVAASGSESQAYRHESYSRADNYAKEERPPGGVSAKLDYELDCMTDFVVEMTQAIIFPGRTAIPSDEIKSWTLSMLSATRLPSSTVAMAMHYLTIRMRLLRHDERAHITSEQMQTMTTVALTLGSKFLDDNTFINRSWSDVSGIKVSKLNREELAWLTSMNWILHRDPQEENGFNAWLRQWKDFEARAADRAQQMSRNKLAPIDTTIHRQGSVHSLRSGFSPRFQDMFSHASASQYSSASSQGPYTPAFGTYDAWGTSRGSIDNSPASAPHTGPTTPEYYYGGSAWSHVDGYTRRSMFGLQPVAQAMPQQQSYGHDNYQHYAAAWSGHPMGCVCFICNPQQHPPSYSIHGTTYAQPVMA